MVNTFENFINRRNTVQSTDLKTKTLTKWTEDLQELYTQLTGYIKEYIQTNQIQEKILDNLHEIQEDGLGKYYVPILELTFLGDNAKICVIPHALKVIGSKGRVDIEGPNGSVMLVRVSEELKQPRVITSIIPSKDLSSPKTATQDNYVWKIAIRKPELCYYPLDQENFQNVLIKLVEG